MIRCGVSPRGPCARLGPQCVDVEVVESEELGAGKGD